MTYIDRLCSWVGMSGFRLQCNCWRPSLWFSPSWHPHLGGESKLIQVIAIINNRAWSTCGVSQVCIWAKLYNIFLVVSTVAFVSQTPSFSTTFASFTRQSFAPWYSGICFLCLGSPPTRSVHHLRLESIQSLLCPSPWINHPALALCVNNLDGQLCNPGGHTWNCVSANRLACPLTSLIHAESAWRIGKPSICDWCIFHFHFPFEVRKAYIATSILIALQINSLLQKVNPILLIAINFYFFTFDSFPILQKVEAVEKQ